MALKTYFFLLLFTFSLWAQVVQEQKDERTRFAVPDLKNSHLILGESQKLSFNSKQINVLVWNVLKAKRENWSTDFIKLAQDADLLLLQEAFLNPLTEEVFESMHGYRLDFGISFLYVKKDSTPTGTVLGSRVHPVLSSILRTVDVEPVIGTPKTITYSYFPLKDTNQTMLVMNIHGLNVTKQKPFERQLQDAFKIIATHQGPIIFGGDFNTRSKNRTELLTELMNTYGLKEVSFQQDDRMTVMGNPLDHVFVRYFKVKEARVLPEIETSDHKPIYLELMLDI